MGEKILSSRELASQFLDAFPMMVDEVMEDVSEYVRADPAYFAEQCYITRALFRFGEFLGLLTLEDGEREDKQFSPSYYKVQATPLVSQVITFK